MGAEARRRAEKYYAKEHIAKQYYDLLQEVITSN
jgi:hypothetical protein